VYARHVKARVYYKKLVRGKREREKERGRERKRVTRS
jgi:hypothetical protein